MPRPEMNSITSQKLTRPHPTPEEYYASMTPDERAEYDAMPSAEDEEARRRQERHKLALIDFGGYVEKAVVDKKDKLIAHLRPAAKRDSIYRANQSGHGKARAEQRKAEYARLTDRRLRTMREAALPDKCKSVRAKANWYLKNAPWGQTLPDGTETPPVPPFETIRKTLIPKLQNPA